MISKLPDNHPNIKCSMLHFILMQRILSYLIVEILASLMIDLLLGNLAKTPLNSQNNEPRVVSPPSKTASFSPIFAL